VQSRANSSFLAVTPALPNSSLNETDMKNSYARGYPAYFLNTHKLTIFTLSTRFQINVVERNEDNNYGAACSSGCS
jgi:hypothetical protein